MDLNGVMIKSWVYKKTLFYLLKLKGVNEPVVLNARDLKSFTIRNDGTIKGIIEFNKFKLASGSSKQYFGNKKTMAEESKDRTFDEFDPYNEGSYLESPEEDMELLGYEYSGIQQELHEGGVDIPDEPLIPGIVIIDPPPPPPDARFEQSKWDDYGD